MLLGSGAAPTVPDKHQVLTVPRSAPELSLAVNRHVPLRAKPSKTVNGLSGRNEPLIVGTLAAHWTGLAASSSCLVD